jgi:chromosome segregation ATPase
MTRLGRAWPLALVASLALAACGLTPEECDPNVVDDVFTSGACQIGGVNDRRVESLEAEVEAKVAAYRLTVAETEALEAEAASLSADRQAWAARRAGLQRQLDRLTLRLDAAQVATAEDEARLDALRAELAAAQGRLDATSADPGTEAEIAALTTEVERRRQAIEAYLDALEVVE